MSSFIAKQLGPNTWADFEALVEKHHGVWGGCWCMEFHCDRPARYDSAEARKLDKMQRVLDGRAHAALVFDEEVLVGWCQFGRRDEINAKYKFKRQYEPGIVEHPDWRITCFFVDRQMRGKGVASFALEAAIEIIRNDGGGLVEAYPEETEGRKLNGSYISLGTTSMFAKRGFEKQRLVAKHHWVMTRRV